MKPSEAMLKGFAMAGGKQCVGEVCIGDPRKPTAVCALGALLLGRAGNARAMGGPAWEMHWKARDAFLRATGDHYVDANNGVCDGQHEPMSIPDIAGILAAEGY